MNQVKEANSIVENAGQSVQLRLEVDGESRVYNSRIEDVLSEEIAISWPTDRMIQVPVSIGQYVQVEARTARGVYRLDTKVAGKSYGTLPMLRIARSGPWIKGQARADVRLDWTVIPSECSLLPEDFQLSQMNAAAAADSQVAGQPITATIRNISAGGMMITTDCQFHRGEYIRSRFSLAENQPEFVTISEVRWVSWDVLLGKQKHKAGCQFLNLQVRQRDAIAKFIFAKQAELRRAGLL